MKKQGIQKYLLCLLIIILFYFIKFSLHEILQDRTSQKEFKTETENILQTASGPDSETTLLSHPPTDWKKYASGSDSRLCILLTDLDSSWLGLTHAFQARGIPFRITRSYEEAFKHKVVLVYPEFKTPPLSKRIIQETKKFLSAGGAIISFGKIDDPNLREFFGLKKANPTKEHFEIHLKEDPLFSEPKEQLIPINPKEKTENHIWSYDYEKENGESLGVYENGKDAIIQNEKGNTYLFGWDLGHFIQQAQNDRLGKTVRSYCNEFDPAIDVLIKMISSIYKRHEQLSVFLDTVPFGKSLSVILTHDIDYKNSVPNAIEYAKLEKSAEVQGTYFIQTKYILDYNDENFFNPAYLKYFQMLSDLKMELGSHSVSHSRQFRDFPIGDGKEKYPSYHPYVVDRSKTINGSILGELRVSKFLLEQPLQNRKIVSFRPGYLAYPESLPELLTSTGYLFSSSMTANSSMTHLPFQINLKRLNQTELELFEFPITYEDTMEEIDNTLDRAVKLSKNISRYGGIFVLLIHPTKTGTKLEFEKQFIESVKSFTWFSTLSDFGYWWTARNKITVDVEQNGEERVVKIESPDAIKGLTLEIPENWTLQTTEQNSSKIYQSKNKVILKELKGSIRLNFRYNFAFQKNKNPV